MLSGILRKIKLANVKINFPTALGQTTHAFFYTLFGTLLPGIIALIILSIFGRIDLIPTVIEKGDFYLYSAGLLSSAIYLFRENRVKLSLIDKVIDPIAIVSLFCSGIIYGVLYTSINLFTPEMLSKYDISISEYFITYSSCFLLAAAILISYRALYIETKKNISPIDVRLASRQNVKDIEDKIGSDFPDHGTDVSNLMDQIGGK